MAFCKFCGSQLEEGQVCSCPQAQAEAATVKTAEPAPAAQPTAAPAAAPAAAAQPSQFGLVMKRFWELVCQFFKQPSKAIRTAVAERQTIPATILVAIRVLLVGFMMLAIHGEAFDGLSSKALRAVGMPSGGEFFMYGILLAVLGTGLFLVAQFCLSKITKSATDFQSAYIANSFGGIWTTCILALAFLAVFVSPDACVLLIAAVPMVAFAGGVLVGQNICADNQSGKFWMLYLVFALAVVLVFFMVAYQLLSDNILSLF